MAAGSTVIAPPEVDGTAPTVAMALTVAPVAAVGDTVARPSAPMVATVGSVVVQAGAGAPTTAWPRASTAAAWNSGISPGGTSKADGVTSTWATTWGTATATGASLPSAAAWIVAPPFATAVTSPPCVTVATDASLVVNR